MNGTLAHVSRSSRTLQEQSLGDQDVTESRRAFCSVPYCSERPVRLGCRQGHCRIVKIGSRRSPFETQEVATTGMIPAAERGHKGRIPEEQRMTTAKNTICLWYDKDAEAAARFYAETFPESAVKAVHRAPTDYPSGKAGDVLTVEFTVLGIPCLGLNGGPMFKHSEAFSFQVATDDQEETDRYWNAIVGNGGQESACGWCRDRWGLSWQITPRVLTDALAVGGEEAKRAFQAMMHMRKIDVAAIEAARRG